LQSILFLKDSGMKISDKEITRHLKNRMRPEVSESSQLSKKAEDPTKEATSEKDTGSEKSTSKKKKKKASIASIVLNHVDTTESLVGSSERTQSDVSSDPEYEEEESSGSSGFRSDEIDPKLEVRNAKQDVKYPARYVRNHAKTPKMDEKQAERAI